MPWRAFGTQTVTAGGTAQPAFGVTTTTAITPTVDPHQNSNEPGFNMPPVSVTVNKINGRVPFQVGDPVLVGAAGGPYESTVVMSVVQASGVITLNGNYLTKSYAVGTFIILNIKCANVLIQQVSDATNNGFLTIGLNDQQSGGAFIGFRVLGTPSATSPTGVLDIFNSSPSTVGNEDESGEYWVNGATTSQKFMASIFQI